MKDLNQIHEPKLIRSIDIDSRAAGFTMPSDPLTCAFLRTIAASKSNWPDGHEAKVEQLISTLEQRTDLRISKMSWASGIIIATKI